MRRARTAPVTRGAAARPAVRARGARRHHRWSHPVRGSTETGRSSSHEAHSIAAPAGTPGPPPAPLRRAPACEKGRATTLTPACRRAARVAGGFRCISRSLRRRRKRPPRSTRRGPTPANPLPPQRSPPRASTRRRRAAAHPASRARKHRTSPAGQRTPARRHRPLSAKPAREAVLMTAQPATNPARTGNRRTPSGVSPSRRVPPRMNHAIAGG